MIIMNLVLLAVVTIVIVGIVTNYIFEKGRQLGRREGRMQILKENEIRSRQINPNEEICSFFNV